MSGNSLLNEDLQSCPPGDHLGDRAGRTDPVRLGIYQLGDGWYGHDGEAIGWQAIELHNPDTGVQW